MSNPTILSDNFAGSPGSFTITGPERYDSGLWLEEGTTNVITNPSFETDVSDWSAGHTITRVTAEHYDGAAAAQIAGVVTSAMGTNASSLPVIQGDPFTMSCYVQGAGVLFQYTAQEQSAAFATLATQNGTGTVLPATWARQVFSGTVAQATAAYLRLRFVYNLSANSQFDAFQLEKKPYATSYTAGTRAASSASVAIAEPVSVACWYREGYSGAKSFAYLDTLGQLGDDGDISYAAGDLTISTSRNLVIGPFAAFDRVLTSKEQANLQRTQNWTNKTVFGPNPYTTYQMRPY